MEYPHRMQSPFWTMPKAFCVKGHFTRHKNTSLCIQCGRIALSESKFAKIHTECFQERTRWIKRRARALKRNLLFQSQEIAYTNYATNIVRDGFNADQLSCGQVLCIASREGFNPTRRACIWNTIPHSVGDHGSISRCIARKKRTWFTRKSIQAGAKDETWASITLDEQLYFPQRHNILVGVSSPLAICSRWVSVMKSSHNIQRIVTYRSILATSGRLLSRWLTAKTSAWSVVAASYNEHLGNYLTLEPGSGDVAGLEQNRNYINSKCWNAYQWRLQRQLSYHIERCTEKELRIPVNLNVTVEAWHQTYWYCRVREHVRGNGEHAGTDVGQSGF